MHRSERRSRYRTLSDKSKVGDADRRYKLTRCVVHERLEGGQAHVQEESVLGVLSEQGRDVGQVAHLLELADRLQASGNRGTTILRAGPR